MFKWMLGVDADVEPFNPRPTHQLDVLGFYCPVPLRTLQQQIKLLTSNDILLVIADDPETQHDIPPFLQRNGHVLRQFIQHQGEFYYVIEVS
jgi:tRNA 2-thiouridine synthesizing protein A